MDPRQQTTWIGIGPCGELRQQADTTCGRAGELKEAAAAARSDFTTVRRELTRVEHILEQARAAADPARFSRGKADARAAYRRAIQVNQGAADRQLAVSTWLREIDRLNRESRRANRALSRVEQATRHAARAAFEAERQADAARIASESASAACADLRQRLAECEAPSDAEMPRQRPAPEADDAASIVRDGTLGPSPLVVEQLVAGDRETLQAVATELATITGQPVSHHLLLLKELVDAIRSVATERMFLAFEDDHPLWSQFNSEERQAIVRALADLGFRYDHEEGWYGGRVPGTGDMAMALAYAGHDPRTIRKPVTLDELRALPQSLVVSPVECLAVLAPNLTLSQMFELLGQRADAMGPLWDDWGRLRPLLLSDAALVAAA